MANKLYEESSIQAIADAIRSKNGLTDTYTVAQMASAIEAIESGGINATAGIVSVTSDCTNYTLTHGLGEVPLFFVIGMKDDFSTLSGATSLFIEGYGFSDVGSQYRISATSSSYSPNGVFRGVSIADAVGSKVSICKATENTIEVAHSGSSHKLIAGATYYWVAIGNGVFA